MLIFVLQNLVLASKCAYKLLKDYLAFTSAPERIFKTCIFCSPTVSAVRVMQAFLVSPSRSPAYSLPEQLSFD